MDENDATEKQLTELEETLAETVMRYEEQICYLHVLLAGDGWYQNGRGEWVHKIAGDENQGMVVTDRHRG